jgi:hypothetical protein
MRRNLTTRWTVAGLVLTAALLPACSDDPSSVAPPSVSPEPTASLPMGTDTGTDTGTVGVPGGDSEDPAPTDTNEVWCEGLRAIDRQAADPASATAPAIDAIERMRLDPVGGSESWLDSLQIAFTAARTTGEAVLIGPTAGERIDARLAAATLHAVAGDGCSWTTVDVGAVDYGYAGIPTTIEAGTTRFRLTNDAPTELHELVVLRKHDATMSTMDLVAMGPGMLGSADLIGGTMIEPGATSAAVLDLTPGSYAVICFIPTAGDADGTPHLAHGMLAEFDVPAS